MSSEGGTHRDLAGASSRTGALPESGRVAVVSGGDVGVGSQLVRCLSELGMRVVLGCRSVDRGRLMIDELGELADRVGVRRLDVTDVDNVEQFTAWVAARLGRCDVLICNLTPGPVPPVDLDAVREELRANLRGIRRLAYAVTPMMRTAAMAASSRSVRTTSYRPGSPRPATG